MRTVLSFVFCLIAVVTWAAEEKLQVVAPAVLPGVSLEMRTAGFWIARHPAPDEPLLADKGVSELNHRIEAQGLSEDLVVFPRVLPGVKVRKDLINIIDAFKRRTLYNIYGKEVSADFIAGFQREVDAVPEKVDVLYGFIVKPSNLRLLPMSEAFFSEPGDVNFDEVQNSVLDIGTPVVVLAHSRDRKWLFIHDTLSAGWVLTESVARSSYDVFSNKVHPERPLVVVSSRADIFLDKEMTEYLAAVRMGVELPYKNVSSSFWEAEVPVADQDGTVKFVSGYIPKKDASARALPCTPRVIYEQAFKLLDAPYGWGDMNGGQDCSRFLQMVFASVGVKLPRNSAEQVKVGTMLPGFKADLAAAEKMSIVKEKGLGGAVILGLKGHIMLYLGPYNDKVYAIHSVWAYREPLPDGTQRARIIGRVAVTSLDLGSGSYKGSLSERIISARALQQ